MLLIAPRSKLNTLRPAWVSSAATMPPVHPAPTVTTSTFFTLLRDMTVAGVLADPIYGGNDNKNGWRMMQYPGAQMSYVDKIASDEFFNIVA